MKHLSRFSPEDAAHIEQQGYAACAVDTKLRSLKVTLFAQRCSSWLYGSCYKCYNIYVCVCVVRAERAGESIRRQRQVQADASREVHGHGRAAPQAARSRQGRHLLLVLHGQRVHRAPLSTQRAHAVTTKTTTKTKTNQSQSKKPTTDKRLRRNMVEDNCQVCFFLLLPLICSSLSLFLLVDVE